MEIRFTVLLPKIKLNLSVSVKLKRDKFPVTDQVSENTNPGSSGFALLCCKAIFIMESGKYLEDYFKCSQNCAFSLQFDNKQCSKYEVMFMGKCSLSCLLLEVHRHQLSHLEKD